jgi:hypothetical protein
LARCPASRTHAPPPPGLPRSLARRQNNLRELWALLHFLEPEKFPDCDAFAERYDTEDAEKVGRQADARARRPTKCQGGASVFGEDGRLPASPLCRWRAASLLLGPLPSRQHPLCLLPAPSA